MQDGIWMEFCKNLDDIEIRQLEENSSYFDYALIQQKERTKTIEINGMSIFRDDENIKLLL